MNDAIRALDSAGLKEEPQRFAMWLFAQFGYTGVCWIPRAELASLWRCTEDTIRRHCVALEEASAGFLRRVGVPGVRQKVLLLFTVDGAGVRQPMGKLGEPLHEHGLGRGWSSQELLGLAAKERANPSPIRGSGSPTPYPRGVEHSQPLTGKGLTTPEALTHEGLNPLPVRGPIKRTNQTNKQQQQAPVLTSDDGAGELGGAAPAAAAAGFDLDRDQCEALAGLGLSEGNSAVGELLVAVAAPGATPEVFAQRFQAALDWAHGQHRPSGALIHAARGGYLGLRIDEQLAPKSEAELGIHEAPATREGAGVPWDRDLEAVVLKLQSRDHWDRRVAQRAIAADFGGDRERALEAHAEQIALVAQDGAPSTSHPGGIDWWRAWVDELRAAQAAGTNEQDAESGAESREVAFG